MHDVEGARGKIQLMRGFENESYLCSSTGLAPNQPRLLAFVNAETMGLSCSPPSAANLQPLSVGTSGVEQPPFAQRRQCQRRKQIVILTHPRLEHDFVCEVRFRARLPPGN